MVKAEGNKKQNIIFRESSLNLFRLLTHHPYFLTAIVKARKKYGISISGISEMLIWKNAHRGKYHNLVADLTELTDSFSIPPQLYRAARQFTLDYVFINKHDCPSNFEVGLNIIRPSEYLKTLTLNPSSVYIEITPGTSEREIRDNWERIVGKRKETRKLDIPTVNPIDERVWELTEQKPRPSDKELTEILKKAFPLNLSTSSFMYDEINKRRFTYKKMLLKLRPFKLSPPSLP